VVGAQYVDADAATLEIVDSAAGEGTHRRLRRIVDSGNGRLLAFQKCKLKGCAGIVVPYGP
jgi:hypothetical protein